MFEQSNPQASHKKPIYLVIGMLSKEYPMNVIQKITHDLKSEYETFAFLKVEVANQAEEIKRLEAKVVRAYSVGYADCFKGMTFDTNFKIDDIELGDTNGRKK